MNKEDFLKTLREWKEGVLKEAVAAGTATEEKINALTASLDAKVKDAVEAMLKRDPVHLGLSAKEKKAFNFGAVVRAMATNDWKAAGHEQEVIRATIERSANASSLAAGAVLIPTDISKDVIDLAIPNIVMMGLGAQELHDLVGEVLIPKVTGRPSIYWVDEEEAPTESGVSLGDVTMNPKTAAAFTKISQQILKQSNDVIHSIVLGELGKSFGIGIDDALLNSVGTSKKPKGIFNHAGFTSNTIAMGNNGKRFTMYEAALMVKAVELANMLSGNPGNYGFLMNPAVKWGMKMERIANYSGQTNGEYAFNPLITDAQLEAMLGYKVRGSTQIASNQTLGSSNTCSTVLFGDFSQIALGFWGTMELRTSDIAGNASGSSFLQRQLWITAFQSLDMAVKNPAGFTKLAGCETNEANWG